ncbi:MAG: hypothetical protein MJZ89_04285 [Paludibacteraceae bacterium]|nr:hypothetical protein [Paludibacteraceae bacterium]
MTYEIISQHEYSLAEFIERMGSMHSRLLPTLNEIGTTCLPEQTTITAICYEYSSTDLYQSPITLSALMLIPMHGGLCAATELHLENRATQAADKSVPTHQWNIGAAHVLTGRVLVSPDLMSFGASVDRPICYTHARLAARNTVDAVIAAQQMLTMHLGLCASPLPVINSGHSQGGFDALAVHRYMETESNPEEQHWLPLLRSVCASGPYVPDLLMEIVAAKEKYLYGAYMVLNAMSHLCYHADCFEPGVQIADFLTPAAQETGIVEMIAAKQHTNVELVKATAAALGTRTAALFVEDVYRPEGKLYAMMKKASEQDRLIDGWTPRLPIHFYHATHDECVPVECTQAVQAVWGQCPNVTFQYDDYADDPMVHRYSGGFFARSVLKKAYG